MPIENYIKCAASAKIEDIIGSEVKCIKISIDEDAGKNFDYIVCAECQLNYKDVTIEFAFT
jgi:hypothetical protein